MLLESWAKVGFSDSSKFDVFVVWDITEAFHKERSVKRAKVVMIGNDVGKMEQIIQVSQHHAYSYCTNFGVFQVAVNVMSY